MSLPESYEEVLERLDDGVQLCDRACWINALERHKRGYVAGDRVHWMPRGVTRRGLYRFLKLVNRAQWGTSQWPYAERVWGDSTAAYDLAMSLGVRIDRETSADDRALLRALLADPNQKVSSDRRPAMERWAREVPSDDATT